MPVTAEIGAAALVLALGLGILIGVFAALRQNRAADHAAMTLAVAGIAVPSFVALPLLGLVFGIYVRWLPVAGWEPGSISAFDPAGHRADFAAVGLRRAAHSREPHRGASAPVHPHRILEGATLAYRRGAARIAPGTPSTLAGYLAPAVASIMTGSLVVESIAGLPGIGRYLVQGALNRDYTLVLGMVILYSVVLIGMGLAADLLYAWLDPRVRFER